ncbi:hydrogenase expression/formation protein [Bradyrhizobium sp. BRP20]|uniref:hydrogenase expression/formation protein n=1 Tax=unclassified Bradyrhizobium TaxID=2631580 RepID=UPI001CD77978|nr:MULTISPECIES: hydrogenase expression/formation protein [unclassified Bradyrhizobium]MCA1436270.1 hydrogenase expression/formation protein [Bradyrhizobium sp. BRP20]MCA1471903.1 hydrogenase expression/formation protein [Bradyrhizobium sp. IC3195]MCA1551724.1 hydrogenase expression/formation protein [Bradyrhizobium sp. BRP19]
MKTALRVASDGAERVASKLAMGSGSLDVFHGGSRSALASGWRDGDGLARNYPNATALLSNAAAAVASQRRGARTQQYGLANLSDPERKLIGEVLGEGEIAGVVALPDGTLAQIRESVLAGIWRVRIGTDPAHEYVEVGAIPQIVRRAASDLTSADIVIRAAPDGAMNVQPLLAEIRERSRVWRFGMRAHVINLTLLPMSVIDLAFLQLSLGNGPVQLIFRGYGTCRVQATGIRNVWSVQFFNSTDNIILDTLEVGGVPIVALAADEDFQDSAERMQEIIKAYVT